MNTWFLNGLWTIQYAYSYLGNLQIWRNLVNSLQQDRKRGEVRTLIPDKLMLETKSANNFTISQYRQQFKFLLDNTPYVTPGKSLNELQVLFMGHECFVSYFKLYKIDNLRRIGLVVDKMQKSLIPQFSISIKFTGSVDRPGNPSNLWAGKKGYKTSSYFLFFEWERSPIIYYL